MHPLFSVQKSVCQCVSVWLECVCEWEEKMERQKWTSSTAVHKGAVDSQHISLSPPPLNSTHYSLCIDRVKLQQVSEHKLVFIIVICFQTKHCLDWHLLLFSCLGCLLWMSFIIKIREISNIINELHVSAVQMKVKERFYNVDREPKSNILLLNDALID